MSDAVIIQYCAEEFDTISTRVPSLRQTYRGNGDPTEYEQFVPGYESRLLNVNLGCEAVNAITGTSPQGSSCGSFPRLLLISL
jgi:hypothetical protein